MTLKPLLAAVLALALPGLAQAGSLTLDYLDSADGLTIQLTGTYDLPSKVQNMTDAPDPRAYFVSEAGHSVLHSYGADSAGPVPEVATFRYHDDILTPLADFVASGRNRYTTSATSGLSFGFRMANTGKGTLSIDSGYVSGELFSGSATFLGFSTSTILGLNFTPMFIDLEDGNTINVRVNGVSALQTLTPAPVPLPAGLPLVLTGLAAFGFLRSRRKS